jgi:hypothetical protein
MWGSISGIFALSLLVELSWVGGLAGQGPPSTGGQPLRTRNCATTLFIVIKILDLELLFLLFPRS